MSKRLSLIEADYDGRIRLLSCRELNLTDATKALFAVLEAPCHKVDTLTNEYIHLSRFDDDARVLYYFPSDDTADMFRWTSRRADISTWKLAPSLLLALFKHPWLSPFTKKLFFYTIHPKHSGCCQLLYNNRGEIVLARLHKNDSTNLKSILIYNPPLPRWTNGNFIELRDHAQTGTSIYFYTEKRLLDGRGAAVMAPIPLCEPIARNDFTWFLTAISGTHFCGYASSPKTNFRVTPKLVETFFLYYTPKQEFLQNRLEYNVGKWRRVWKPVFLSIIAAFLHLLPPYVLIAIADHMSHRIADVALWRKVKIVERIRNAQQ